MKDLRHDNLNPFTGACVDPPNICIVTEYCAKGSLKDVLENEDVKLDNMFNASIIGDIVRGMTYLHDSQLRSHGNLKSTNCLVDSRWVVKIADFGLHELKFGADSGDDDSTDFEKQCAKLLWRAPELLRDPNARPSGTQKGDVYSFGIILYEIMARSGPFGQTDKTPSEIIKCVMRRDRNPPFRPRISKLEDSFDCVIDCMQECWAEDPEDRPDFKTIRTKLRPMRKGMKNNIFDNMLAMMEKYANNLEALVDERTDQLIEEKKKTDALLYEMLPKQGDYRKGSTYFGFIFANNPEECCLYSLACNEIRSNAEDFRKPGPTRLVIKNCVNNGEVMLYLKTESILRVRL
ncbi:Receptor-type guanylate cyclase Gyc76C [Araneus ventricosus]|uniref:guanylate cyclase n=1 Tax=Araneus ventricosus TaxID=182803 RepID=A0A4Y2JX38_ARAVE|nr:Receptor-type guanylate cyclase Gyc76C [Araneus ventricosus]